MIIIREDESVGYSHRTKYNAHSADLTIAVAADYSTSGEVLTKKFAGGNYLALPIINDPLTSARKLYVELHKRNAKTLNIAGNGIYTFSIYGYTQEVINQWMYELLLPIQEFHPLTKIYNGGQTGADLAGTVAANALGIDCESTLPKGYKMRFKEGKDIFMAKVAVEDLIKAYTYKLDIKN